MDIHIPMPMHMHMHMHIRVHTYMYACMHTYFYTHPTLSTSPSKPCTWTPAQNADKAGHHHPRGRPGPTDSTGTAANVSATVNDDNGDSYFFFFLFHLASLLLLLLLLPFRHYYWLRPRSYSLRPRGPGQPEFQILSMCKQAAPMPTPKPKWRG